MPEGPICPVIGVIVQYFIDGAGISGYSHYRMRTEPRPLTDLPNIGSTLARELAKVGVANERHLKKLGSIDAAVRISYAGKGACYNILYALEGAIRGVRWHLIPKAERERIKRKFDEKRGAISETT